MATIGLGMFTVSSDRRVQYVIMGQITKSTKPTVAPNAFSLRSPFRVRPCPPANDASY